MVARVNSAAVAVYHNGVAHELGCWVCSLVKEGVQVCPCLLPELTQRLLRV